MADGFLTTHVLDTALGLPAAGLQIDLYRLDGESRKHIVTQHTNAEGRTDAPMLPVDLFRAGRYELLFHAGAYLDKLGIETQLLKFLDQIPIRFGIADEDSHYHVPLLLSPYGFSTYRGS